jgi:hypothetical protein
MFTETEIFESPNLNLLDSCLWDLMNSELYERQLDIRDKLVADILDAAACLKRREVRLRRALQWALRLVVGVSSIYCEM